MAWNLEMIGVCIRYPIFENVSAWILPNTEIHVHILLRMMLNPFWRLNKVT